MQTLLATGYDRESGMSAPDFLAVVEPLRGVVLSACRESEGPTNERVPFVLVVTKALVAAERAMPLTRHRGKPGFVSADTTDIGRFEAIEAVELPDGDAYVVIDVAGNPHTWLGTASCLGRAGVSRGT